MVEAIAVVAAMVSLKQDRYAACFLTPYRAPSMMLYRDCCFKVEDEHPEWLRDTTATGDDERNSSSAEGGSGDEDTDSSAAAGSDVDVPEELREYKIS